MKIHNNKISYWRKIAAWLLTISCLAGIPAALLSFSTIRYYSNLEEELKFNLKMRLQQAANETVRNLNQEKFWCQLFFEKFIEFRAQKSGMQDIISWLKQLQQGFPREFEYIVWDKTGKQLAISFASDLSTDEWYEVISVIASFRIPGAPSKGFERKNSSLANVKKFFGPQLLRQTFVGIEDPDNFSLGWADSAGKKPPIAPYFVDNGAILIIYDRDKLQQHSGVKNSLQQIDDDLQISYGIYDNSADNPQAIWQINPLTDDDLQPLLASCEKEALNFCEFRNCYLEIQQLSPKLRIFASCRRNLSALSIGFRALAVAMCYLLLMLPFLRYTWQTSVKGQPGKISIKYKLAFLFLFACGIPLLTMVIISQEHYSQKRQTLMTEIHQNTINMLLSIDRRYLSTLNTLSVRLDHFFLGWSKSAAKKVFSTELNNLIATQIDAYRARNFYMISSSTHTIGAYEGVFNYHGELDAAKIEDTEKSLSGNSASDMIAANMVGKKVMSDLNRIEIPGKIMSKLDLVVESVLQKTFTEMTYSIIQGIGRINRWGFAQAKNFSYFKFISLLDPNVTDYAAMVFWKPVTIQENFLVKAIDAANRNSQGFKIMARNRMTNRFIPESAMVSERLKAFARRLGPKPTEEIELLTINNEEYITLGFNGQHLDYFQIILLYPVKNIELLIGRQKTELLLLGLFSLLLAAGLAKILAKSFVQPLATLRDGALAIENRQFSHRIAKPGKDEFGKVAEIFNEVMVGLAELEVAQLVQESLFPQPSFAQGRCYIYGKSICMSELGGDYLDFFSIDDSHIAVLMGDVAGHGVGAALIMAMAKAGILSSGEQLSTPQALLLKLHKMILASKSSRQKKVMTFQYLFLNTETSTGIYSNAGGCSPLLVRHNGQVEEVQLAGAALGAFKKATYSEKKIALNPGEAMVFYTDGIVESRNLAGLEIGYEGFAEMLKKAYDPDPKIYYDNIFALYTSHIGAQSAQDDLTLIIMICT